VAALDGRFVSRRDRCFQQGEAVGGDGADSRCRELGYGAAVDRVDEGGGDSRVETQGGGFWEAGFSFSEGAGRGVVDGCCSGLAAPTGLVVASLLGTGMGVRSMGRSRSRMRISG
jgi:hypothetical protein